MGRTGKDLILRDGEWIGDYRVVKNISRGGMGEVYLALYRGFSGFEKEVVLKTLPEEMTREPEFLKILMREANLASLLIHPNIVQIFGFLEEKGRYFIVMEYVQGCDLRSIMRISHEKGLPFLPTAPALYIVIQIAKGLDHAHNFRRPEKGIEGIIHSDISPENILLSRSCEVKLGDFGIARVKSETGPELSVMGKSSYMAPERIRGGIIDERCDIFSLGVVLYEALSGKRLFFSASPDVTFKRILEGRPPPLDRFNPSIPAELQTVIMKSLEKDPDARYSSASEFSRALLPYLIREGKGDMGGLDELFSGLQGLEAV